MFGQHLARVLAPFHCGGMGSKHFRTIHDFSRHRYDIELTCYCGHMAVLAFCPVVAKFAQEGWPITLGSAAGYFRCSQCGSSPRQIGPIER
jgi:hypothetical protein